MKKRDDEMMWFNTLKCFFQLNVKFQSLEMYSNIPNVEPTHLPNGFGSSNIEHKANKQTVAIFFSLTKLTKLTKPIFIPCSNYVLSFEK